MVALYNLASCNSPLLSRLNKVGLLAAVALFPSALHADTGEVQLAPLVTVGEPEGFSSFLGSQQAVVDLYFGAVRLGEAQVRLSQGSIEFAEPDKVARLLPGVTNTAILEQALANELPSNISLVCTDSADPARCGQLAPQLAGVIFDPDRFRVDLFVNPKLLILHSLETEKYVPRPDTALSVVNSIGGVIAGTNEGAKQYNVQNQLIVASANIRLRNDLFYASGRGLQADQLVAELDSGDRRYLAGALHVPGSQFTGRRKIAGLGFETQVDTRLDKETLVGSPLIAFLNRRARIDILRDGRVLASGFYDAGSQRLDTSSMPNGSYEVVIRIEEAGGLVREERRFFTKNPNIVAVGQKRLFAYAGLLARLNSNKFLSVTKTPFIQAGAARRIGGHFAADATVLATDKSVLGEAGVYYLSHSAQIRVAALASSTGTHGGAIQVNSQGSGRLSFNFDLRRMKIGNRSPMSGLEDIATAADHLQGNTPVLFGPAGSSFSQLTGYLAYGFPQVQFGLVGSYRRQDGQSASYSIGPSLRWQLLRRGPMRISFEADATITNQGKSGFAGITVQLVGQRSLLEGRVGARNVNMPEGRSRTSLVGTVNGAVQFEDVAGAELGLGAGFERNESQDVVSMTGRLRSRPIELSGDVLHHLKGPTQYTMGFGTTVAISGGAIAFQAQKQNDSVVIVKVQSGQTGDLFEVLVDDAPVGSVRSGSNLAVSLPPYHRYSIRVRPVSKQLLQYDGTPKIISLYPGSVARLAWTAKPVIAMVGRLVFEDGEPVRMALVMMDGSISETDVNGFFQIEAAPHSQLNVALPSGGTCRATVPSIGNDSEYAAIGTLICQKYAPSIRITAANRR